MYTKVNEKNNAPFVSDFPELFLLQQPKNVLMKREYFIAWQQTELMHGPIIGPHSAYTPAVE